MSNTSENISDPLYWIAIQSLPTIPSEISGPYTKAEADFQRESSLMVYPAPARISLVFRAESREKAQLQAEQFMPPVNDAPAGEIG